MNFARRNRLTVFFGSLLATGILSACLETPGAPEISESLTSVSVCLSQYGNVCSESLSAAPADSFLLQASVAPSSLKSELSFRWVAASNILAQGTSFSTDTSRVPDSLVIIDRSKNRLAFALSFVFDTAPVMLAKTVPANGDTLVGDSATAFRFAYQATDADRNDSLAYSVRLDSSLFSTGSLTEFAQSGFSEGSHTMQVFVEDLYGLRDSTDLVSFFVKSGERL